MSESNDVIIDWLLTVSFLDRFFDYRSITNHFVLCIKYYNNTDFYNLLKMKIERIECAYVIMVLDSPCLFLRKEKTG